jgi:starch-binding outer membrane protein, SusD/RagB family
MKNSLYLIASSALILMSCSEDFLNKVPESTLTAGSFYKNENHLNQALNGAYQVLRSTSSGFNAAVYSMGEMRSDNTHYTFNSGNRSDGMVHREDADNFLDESVSSVVSSRYNSLYTGISRVNSLLKNIPVLELTEEAENRITGEAKFLRALFYFDLVRYFGGVPIYLQEVRDASSAFVQRSSVQDVYDVILSDLQEAVTKLRVPNFPQDGRATQGSARMLLADVYLTLKNYPLAEAELIKITEMGYDLLPDYASVFRLNNKRSIEHIFEVQYDAGLQQHSNPYNFLPYSMDLSIITGISGVNNNTSGAGFNVPTSDLIDSYEPNDTRLEASIAIAEGTGERNMMVIETVISPLNYTPPAGKVSNAFIKKFVNPHAIRNQADDNFPVYRYSEVLLSLAEVLNEQNKSSEALPYLNLVRYRAGLLPITESNQDLLRDIIAHERRVELAFENKRWLDLVRTGKAIEVMNNFGEYIKEVYGPLGYLRTDAYNVTSNRLIFPIPYREIQIAKLEQNPGY